MGHRLKISATLTSIILLSGMLGFGFSPDAFALSERGAEKGNANGCQNGEAKNNPHCNGDGSFTECDNNPVDGAIDAAELQAHIGGTLLNAQQKIDDAEFFAGADSNNNNVIDNGDELFWLNSIITPVCS